MSTKLTAKGIESLADGKARSERGLTVRRRGSSRAWSFAYTRAGKRESVTLGEYPALSLKEARHKAAALRQLLRDGGDPKAEAKPSQRRTVADLMAWARESYYGTAAVRPATRRIFDQAVRLHVLPYPIHRQFAGDLARRDVRRWHAALVKDCGPSAANIALRMLRSSFNKAIELDEEGGPEVNPCEKIGEAKEQGRGHKEELTPAEYRRLVDELRRAREGRSMVPYLCIELLALTGMRRGEAANLRRGEVDFEAGKIRIEEHKGMRSGVERVISINAPIESVLRRALALADEVGSMAWVFPAARNPGRPVSPESLSTRWQEIRHDAKLPQGVRLHDLRHSYITRLSHEVSALHLQMHAGHADPRTTRGYVHGVHRGVAVVGQAAEAVFAGILGE